MPYTFDFDGVTREFEFYAPVGWDLHIRRAGRGLPVVIALHDAFLGPYWFRRVWPFQEIPIQKTPLEAVPEEDRFFVFFPYAAGYSSQRRSNDPPSPLNPVERVWNYGYDSRGYHNHRDAEFITAAVQKMRAHLSAALADQQGVTTEPFDAERVFVFGSGEGGMMAHRLVRRYPGTIGAVWALSASHGGVAHAGVANLPLVVNGPAPGDTETSLYLHYGGQDRFVLPAAQAPGVPEPSTSDADRRFDESLNYNASQKWARADLAPTEGAQAYRDAIGATAGAVVLPGRDVLGGVSSTVTTSFRPFQAQSPEVVVYYDPEMTHTNLVCDPAYGAGIPDRDPSDATLEAYAERLMTTYFAPPNRYKTEIDVWEWFKRHPRSPP